MRGGGAAARCAGAGCGSGRRDRPRSPWGTVEGCRGLGAAAAGRAPRRIRTQGRPLHAYARHARGPPAAPRRPSPPAPARGRAAEGRERGRKVAGSPGGGSGRPLRRPSMSRGRTGRTGWPPGRGNGRPHTACARPEGGHGPRTQRSAGPHRAARRRAEARPAPRRAPCDGHPTPAAGGRRPRGGAGTLPPPLAA